MRVHYSVCTVHVKWAVQKGEQIHRFRIRIPSELRKGQRIHLGLRQVDLWHKHVPSPTAFSLFQSPFSDSRKVGDIDP